jgi:hypothetical protein
MQEEVNQIEDTQATLRPGYSVRVTADKTYLLPTVLEQRDLSLGLMEMPNLVEALEQDGGVSSFRRITPTIYSYNSFL